MFDYYNSNSTLYFNNINKTIKSNKIQSKNIPYFYSSVKNNIVDNNLNNKEEKDNKTTKNDKNIKNK